MRTTVGIPKSAALLVLSFTAISFSAEAGVEPSPFTPEQIVAAVGRISDRLDAAIQLRVVSPEIQKRAAAIKKQLLEIKTKVSTTKQPDFIGKAVGIMDSLSAVMREPKPNPPVSAATLNILERLSAAALGPQPEPPDSKMKAVGIMSRIAAVAFNPQPEPPARSSGIAILDKISAVAFNPQPEPPAVVGRLMDALDSMTSVMFNPQPEPPARGAAKTVAEAVGLMADLLDPKVLKPVLQK